MPTSQQQNLLKLWRRGWDSNPRSPMGTAVFETARFGHSRTSPQESSKVGKSKRRSGLVTLLHWGLLTDRVTELTKKGLNQLLALTLQQSSDHLNVVVQPSFGG